MSAEPAATAEAAETSSSTLSLLAASLPLTAEAWSKIKRAGACACCAARLAGCRDPAAYACSERQLRVQLDTRFRAAPTTSNGDFDPGGAVSEGAREDCCPLCLGLLQDEVPIRMAPRPQRSSELHGDHNRACEQAGGPAPRPPPDLGKANEKDETGPPPAAATAVATTTSVDGDKVPRAGDRPPTTAALDKGFRRAGMVDAIAECITARGYSVTSFGITAAIPACLMLRDAAFLEAGLGVSPAAASDGAMPSAPTAPPTTAPPAVVPVKEALKVGLNRALQYRFHLAGEETTAGKGTEGVAAEASPPPVAAAAATAASSEQDSDFSVEVTAKSPEADAHAVTTLLGGPGPSRPAGAKPHTWRGGGKWAKKRQRREEQRNPGLTVGAVKKGLATLDDAGKERMRRWVQGLLEGEKGCGDGGEGGTERGSREGQACPGEPAGGAAGDHGAAAVGGASEAADAGREDPDKVVNGAATCEAANASNHGDSTDKDLSCAATVAAADRPPPAKPRGVASGSSSTNAAPGSDTPRTEATCEVAVRRQSIHFWGRYTKHSRSVPQTPWIKGFFSVQEAVSEPFEAFSGCVEGLLHGAGREDVNVRMLGKGRPFCLELIDSLRTVDEVAARLPSLEAAINAAGGRKNAGGGVAVSRLRVAGPGELPGDVQAVGEGKRKHYRCMVWVSRAVRKEEVVKMIRDAPEEMVVQQATPIRVLHRRTLLDRPRSIFDMRAEWINEHFFQLDLTTSAGEEGGGRVMGGTTPICCPFACLYVLSWPGATGVTDFTWRIDPPQCSRLLWGALAWPRARTVSRRLAGWLLINRWRRLATKAAMCRCCCCWAWMRFWCRRDLG